MILSSGYRAAGSVLRTSQNSVIQYYAGLKPSPIILWICISLFVIYPLSFFLALHGIVDLSNNILNRILTVLIGGFGLLNAFAIIRYYFRNITLVDLLFILFTFFYFYGLNDLNMQAYSRYGRCVIWFYVVPYYIRKSYHQVKYITNVLVPILAAIIFTSYISLNYVEHYGRLSLAGGYTATGRFYLSIFSICLIIFVNVKMPFIQRVFAVLAMIGSIVLAFLSGSRQILLGLIVILALPYLISMKWKEAFSIKTITIFFLIGVSIVLAFSVNSFNAQRTLSDYHDPSVLGRILRYEYFTQVLAQDFPGSLIKGRKFISDQKIHYGGLWIDLAPHNVYLCYATFAGIMSSILLLVFHLYCFSIILCNYSQLKKWRASIYIVPFLTAVYLIAQFENFLYFVSNLESYLFYAGLGFFVNIWRDRKRLKVFCGLST
ncbi:MAG: hypothetical protein DRH24_16495 [Deltaproteobacteria bacterium]|nr:MAG: hypothetical protein DRH24_16495 [Deltaproteobacteria bacterium]